MATLRKTKLSQKQKEILVKKLKIAATGNPVSGLPIDVNLTVSGGVSGEFFYESIGFDSDGNIYYEIEDQIEKTVRKRTSGRVKVKQLRDVFNDILKSKVLDMQDFAQQIPPDTVVGFITVRSGKKEKSVFFPMDDFAPEKPRVAPVDILLHSGKALKIQSKFVPKKIMNTMDSISKIPDLIKK